MQTSVHTAPSCSEKQVSLPRIAVRDAQFINTETGAVFYPRGFNYIRLENSGIWHNTLNAESYNPSRADAMFRDLARNGFNIARVFIPEDTMDDPSSPDHIRNDAFANLLDFLGKARAHRIYVILSLLHCPASMIPEPFSGEDDPDFVLNEVRLQAKARYHKNMIRRIRAHDPNLLSTVFSYEHGNELCFWSDRPPFSVPEKWLNRMDPCIISEEIQQFTDEATGTYANVLSQAVKDEDPDALFSINVFSFEAVGRSGPNRVQIDKTVDARFPARALILAASAIDYLDVHLYPADLSALKRDLQSIEWDQTIARLRKTGKPAIIGETGVFREWQPDPQAAATQMQTLLPNMFNAGFQGFLYWTYDCDEQSQQLWHARDKENPAVLQQLIEIHPDA